MTNRIYIPVCSTVANRYQEWSSENSTLQELADKSIKQMRLERKKNEGKKHEKNYRKAFTISSLL